MPKNPAVSLTHIAPPPQQAMQGVASNQDVQYHSSLTKDNKRKRLCSRHLQCKMVIPLVRSCNIEVELTNYRVEPPLKTANKR